MDNQFLQWLVAQTGVAGIAGLALWMLRETYRENRRVSEEAATRELRLMKESGERELRLMKESGERELRREQEVRQAIQSNNELVLEAIRQNSQAMTQNAACLDRMTNAVEKAKDIVALCDRR